MCRCLTSRVLIARLRRRYPGPQSPPCSSDTQSTQGDTCVLRPPGTTNKTGWSSKHSHNSKQREIICGRWGCCSVLLWFSRQRWVSYAACCGLPSSCCEWWHNRNTCFTLTLSGICYDVTSLYRSEPLVSLTFSLWTLWNPLPVCHVHSLSLTLPKPFPFLNFTLPIHLAFSFSLMQDEIMCQPFSKQVI